MSHPNSFGARTSLDVGGTAYSIFRLDALSGLAGAHVDQLPVSLRVLLENLLRCEDGAFVKKSDIEALAAWDVKAATERRFAPVGGRQSDGPRNMAGNVELLFAGIKVNRRDRLRFESSDENVRLNKNLGVWVRIGG